MPKRRKKSILDIFMPRRREIRRIRHLEKELVRRDNMIREMREKNDLLLKTSMRQSKEIVSLQERLRQLNARR